MGTWLIWCLRLEAQRHRDVSCADQKQQCLTWLMQIRACDINRTVRRAWSAWTFIVTSQMRWSRFHERMQTHVAQRVFIKWRRINASQLRYKRLIIAAKEQILYLVRCCLVWWNGYKQSQLTLRRCDEMQELLWEKSALAALVIMSG